ncbi:MAG TPA: PPOX class F420-dependent oxidoreductase [Chloroflexia bacterium]|nr:PPOX class F420-dependent oxidoreductase [Chloroflexia bacterium]
MSALTPQQRKLFEEPNFVTVATLGKDGTPRNTAIWVDIEGDYILLNGATSRQWLKNLERDPHVALSIFDLKNPYHQATVIGEAVSITKEGGEEHIDKLSRKYMGHDYTAHDPNDPRQIVRVAIKSARGG